MGVMQRLTAAFPLWVALASAAALVHPPLFTWFRGPLITVGLGLIMLGMGVTLTVDDFKRIARMPGPVFLGVALQFTVMPMTGWAVAKALDLSNPFAVGLILVASCPGGTASNVISYLAKADVPLSVTMTSVSTVMAVAMTPLLTAAFAGSRVDVPALGLFVSTLQVVLFPVALGVLLNRYLPRVTERILPAAPAVAVLFITLIVASVIGEGRNAILGAGWRLIAAVFALHFSGFLFGYLFSRVVTHNVISSRTISIEVGMQNSGLGVVLARGNFADPLFAVPSAISSLFHSLIASLLAAWWRRDAERRGRGGPAA